MLFADVHHVTLKTGPVEEREILRIDTQTGAVEEWVSGYDKNGQIVNGWLLIGEK
jgi:hypothetical protein